MASYQEATGYCSKCEKDILIKRPKANHILHLFISIFTLGLWIPVWILLSIQIGGWRCTACGKRVTRKILG